MNKILGTVACTAVTGFVTTFGVPVVIGIGIGVIGSAVVHKITEHHKAKNEEVIIVPEEEVAAQEAANA